MKLGLNVLPAAGFGHKNNAIKKFSGAHNIPNMAYSLNTDYTNNYAALPTAKHYLANYLPQSLPSLSFTGGCSLDLRETIENTKCVYPPDIKELAELELENGNPDNKRLIDIHKDKYDKINKMKSLAEVKAEFPEFKDVLSDNEVEYNKKSFIHKVKTGQHEWFDEDTDVALQLLQMYWADGMSQEQIKQYTDGTNIGGVFEKLHIPTMNRTYNYVLQMSDENYNKKITDKMSEKQKGIKKHRKNGSQSIQRAPMSEEQKAKHSEDMVRYWANHPERSMEQSERMKQYFEEHPEVKERLSLVLTTAWGLNSAKSIRKKMSKFFGKKDITPEEFAKNALNGGDIYVNGEKRTLKQFWDKNYWAKERWSACMKDAWEIVKKNEASDEIFDEALGKNNPKEGEYDYAIDLYPPSLLKDMKRWFIRNGYDLDQIPKTSYQALVTLGDKPVPKGSDYAHEALTAYFSDNSKDNLRADMLQICMFKTLSDIGNARGVTENKVLIQNRLQRVLMNENCVPYVLSTQEALNTYVNTVVYCYKNGEDKLAQQLQNNLEDAYQILVNDRQKVLSKIVQNAILSAKLKNS